MKKLIIHGTVFFLIAIALLFRTNSLPGYFFRAYLGNAEAMNEVSSYYYSKEKYDIAEKWSAKSAEKGSVRGYISYAYLSALRGEKEKSVEILKKGVENGCIRCGYYLARGFAYGRLIEDLLGEEMVISPEESAKWAIRTSLFTTNDDNEKELIIASLYACADINFKGRENDFINAKNCAEKAINSTYYKTHGTRYRGDFEKIYSLINLYGAIGIEPNEKKGAEYFINYIGNIEKERFVDYDNYLEAIKILFNGKGFEKNIKKAKELSKDHLFEDLLEIPLGKESEIYRCVEVLAFNRGSYIVDLTKEKNQYKIVERTGKNRKILKKISVSTEQLDILRDKLQKEDLFSTYNYNYPGCLSEGSSSNFYARKGAELQLLYYTCHHKPIIKPFCSEIFKLAGLEIKFNQ